MIDRSLMFQTLRTLQDRRDVAGGIEETVLFDEINLRASRAITTSLITEHLIFAQDKGWVDWKLDALRKKHWRITPAGETAIDDLKGA